jgi:hypothetical protein
MEEERDDLDGYMLELVDLMLEDRHVTNFKKWKSQNEGYLGKATISGRRTEDFT